jgi:hypothetical protein
MLIAGKLYVSNIPYQSHTKPSYLEGIVRGYRNTLLTSQNYGNLVQCETIDGKAKPKNLQFYTRRIFLTLQTL